MCCLESVAMVDVLDMLMLLWILRRIFFHVELVMGFFKGTYFHASGWPHFVLLGGGKERCMVYGSKVDSMV